MTKTTTTYLTTSTSECIKFYGETKSTKSYFNNLMDTWFPKKKKQQQQQQRHVSAPVIIPPKTVYPPIKFLDCSPDTNTCLNDDLARKVQCFLPKRISIASKWSLVYSLDQHGASLNTLYNKTLDCGPCLVVIENDQDEIFGAYLSEGFHVDTGYYGTGECFLWKQNKETKQVVPYCWSMLNDYLIYSNHDFFAIGGGQGNFGLWLSSDLAHGYTGPCITFNNSTLCKEHAFNCVALEIWSFEY